MIKRYSKANNKYLINSDPTKLEKHLLYVDTNNLYGWAVSQKLLYKGTMWADPNIRTLEEGKEEIFELSENEDYIIDYDLEYPKKLP